MCGCVGAQGEDPSGGVPAGRPASQELGPRDWDGRRLRRPLDRASVEVSKMQLQDIERATFRSSHTECCRSSQLRSPCLA